MSLFEELGLRPELVAAVTGMGFTQPTPIQQQAIPALLTEPRDLVGLAQTGTGKTAAFGLPLLHHLDLAERTPQALILCPTRELCLQITADLRTFGSQLKGLRVASVYGGASVSAQIAELRQGAQVVVGTPGRLIDLIERRALKLGEVKIAVLDEADEMLSMGFVDDIERILSETPEEKVTWLFSATMPAQVERIAARFMSDPIRLKSAGTNKTADNIDHQYYVVHARDRYPALRRIIDHHPGFYGIVFCRTRMGTQELAERLIRDGYTADALHGDLSQAQRDFVMKRYRSRTLQLLVATDVAARGIDVDDVTHVIHYELPDEPEVYTHRSGRTARAGKSGISALIVGMKETGRLRDIERVVGKKLTRVQVPSGAQVCARQASVLVDKVLAEPEDPASFAAMLPVVTEALSILERDELIERFMALLLSERLAAYKDAPDLNVGSKNASVPESRGDFTRYFISLGRLDGMYKADILRYFCEMLGTDRHSIGRIDVQQSFSFVEISGIPQEQVLAAFENRKYRGRPVRVNLSESQGERPAFRGKKPYGDKPFGKSKYRKEDGGSKYRKEDGGYQKENGSYRKKESFYKKDDSRGKPEEKKSYGFAADDRKSSGEGRADKFRKTKKGKY